ncbi:hypothetical protein CYMTET_28701 [Cymbomonas tetramitiformis]|uniref:Uncharacterized protein n=1 Tax=Cymbomonas tetramitiformis TaxID=36881 RepID=A0AAE0FNX7_9CHLO|nr:hypothetical protein CYMTET_28701 [Cymbomonas tetramitiformis]
MSSSNLAFKSPPFKTGYVHFVSTMVSYKKWDKFVAELSDEDEAPSNLQPLADGRTVSEKVIAAYSENFEALKAHRAYKTSSHSERRAKIDSERASPSRERRTTDSSKISTTEGNGFPDSGMHCVRTSAVCLALLGAGLSLRKEETLREKL